jgi:hypothetical protein
MAHSSNTDEYGLPAAIDFSALTSPFRLLVMNGAGAWALCGAGIRADAVGSSPVKAGQIARGWLPHSAVRKIEAGAAIAAYASLMSDATGRVVTATTGNKIIGKALAAASAAGDLITVLYDTGLGTAP